MKKKWHRLDKESLEWFKTGESFLFTGLSNIEFPYNTLEYVQTQIKDTPSHWYSTFNAMMGEDKCIYYDEEVLYEFPYVRVYDQPERSKREDSRKCEMRCSEHCGNTVRDK
jgi:hypothetical protein